jgi:outer membrane autotransporter protein
MPRRTPSIILQAAVVIFVLQTWLAIPLPAQSLNTLPGLTPPEQAMATAIVTLWPPLTGQRLEVGPGAFTPMQNDLIDRCGEMVRNGEVQANIPETREALLNVSAEELAAQGTTSVETASVQLSNLGTRLAALRGGATGISLQGLAFDINGQTLTGDMVARVAPGHARWDVEKAEGFEIVRAWRSLAHQKPFSGSGFAGLASPANDRMAASADQASLIRRLGVFVNGTISLGDKDTTTREAGFDFTTLGVTAGVDYRLTRNVVLGLAFGFASTDADVSPSGGGGDLDSKDYSISLYGTYYRENFYVDGIVGGGWNTYDASRRIAYVLPTTTPAPVLSPMVTTVNQVATGDTDGTHYSFGLGTGYDFRHQAWTFGPYGRLTYLKAAIEAFQERINNAGPGSGLGLAYNDQRFESLQTALGAQVSYAVSTPLAVLVPQLLFEWVHEYLNDRRTVTASYVNDPQHVPIPFTTDDPDRNFFNLSMALSSVFRGGTSAFLYYQTALGLRDVSKHDIVLGVRLAFY